MRKSRVVLLGVLASVLALPALADNLGHISWQIPTERENGDRMEPEEIGGYEVRYLSGGEEQTLIIPDGTATGYDLDGLEPAPDTGQPSMPVAVYDTNGLYSDFVPIDVRIPSPPGPLQTSYSPPGAVDPAELCAPSPACRVDVLSARYGQDE